MSPSEPKLGSLRFAERLLALVVPVETASAIIGDLQEELKLNLHRFPRLWLSFQVAAHMVAAVSSPAGFLPRWWRAVRYALRPWRRRPAIPLVSAATLALAFAAYVAFFAISNAVSFRSLPVDQADELVSIQAQNQRGALSVTSALFDEISKRQLPVTGLAGYLGARMMSELNGGATQLPVALVSSDFFRVLKGRPIVGRMLEASDFGVAANSTAHVVVLGARFWRSAFAADPNVVGKQIRLEKLTLTVVGIVPDGETSLQVESFNSLVLPAPLLAELVGEPSATFDLSYQFLVGRLSPGATIATLQAQLLTEWPTIDAQASARERYPTTTRRLIVQSAETGFSFLRTRYQGALRLLTALAALMIVVAGLSVGGLIVASIIERLPELHLRLALGASRSDLLAQVVAEAGAICGLGSLLGSLLGNFAARPLLTRLWPAVDLRDVDLSVDWRVSTVAAAALSFAVAAASLAPSIIAMRTAGRAGVGTLRTSTSRRNVSQAIALVGQLALTLVLVLAAGAFVRTLNSVRPDDPQLESESLMIARLSPLPHTPVTSSDTSYNHALVERIATIAGVQSIALTRTAPFLGVQSYQVLQAADPASADTADHIDCVLAFVGPGFFTTIGLPLLSGRDLSESVGDSSSGAAVLSASVVQRLFHGVDPINRPLRLGLGSAARDVTIIGVVADTRYQDVRVPQPFVVYLSPRTVGQAVRYGNVVLRTTTTSSVGLDAMNRAVLSLGREQVSSLRSFAAEERTALLNERLTASLGLFFGILSCLLAAIGVYSRTAQVVGQRRREFGVRLALGALPSALQVRVIREAIQTAAWSLLVGVPLAFALRAVAQSQLYGLRSFGFDVLALGIAILLLVTIGGSFLPARSIVRENTIESLRGD